MKIVVFKLNHLGDNVVFLPAVQALRARFPESRLTILTTPQEKVLYENLTTPDELFASDKLRFDKCWRRPWELAAWLARVRSRRPDACLVSFDQANISHLLARSSGAAIRVGGNLEHIRLRHTLTHEVTMPPSGWVAEWNWAMARTLVHAAGGGELPGTPPPPDLSHLVSIPPQRRVRPRVVIHAGSSGEITRWPIERFAAVAAGLARDHDVVWVDRPETSAVILLAGVTSFAPESLRAFVTLLAGADFFLGNNSGPMHLANALGLRGVVVTGSTARGWDPYWFRERWTVLRHPSLPCQPCERPNKVTSVCANPAAPFACLRHWSAEAVEAACRETLARAAEIPQG
jgi:ADP-heptose:LPS heptosyltransferase